MKIGIITYQNAINNGAILQAKGLLEKLEQCFPGSNIEFINYLSPNMELYELLKCLKLYKKKPFFNLRRYIKFRRFIPRFLKLSNHVYCGNLLGVITKLNRTYKSNDLLICGSDCIWKLSSDKFLPPFPNIYWLSEKIKAHKASYAASAYQYNKKLFLENKMAIQKILITFDSISVRDEDTLNMVSSLNLKNEIVKVPDPAFFYSIKKTNVDRVLIKKGINLEKPIFALITSYYDNRIKDIVTHFRNNGFQIIGLSMYNSLVDFNMGDELTPDQWGEVFKYVSFCATDRFHGAIFCIKNATPFITIETKNTPKEKSKKYQVLKDFNLLDCYCDVYSDSFSISKVYTKLTKDWEKHKVSISKGLKKQISIGENYLKNLKVLLEND